MRKYFIAGLSGMIIGVIAGLIASGSIALAEDPTPTPAPTATPVASATPDTSASPAATQSPQPTENPNAVSASSFPDKTFRTYISEKIDTDGDKILSDAEMKAVTAINIRNMGISNLKGIEKFTSLKTLLCSGNNINTADLSHNTLLEKLDISDNELYSIDLSACKRLTTLDISGNRLTDIDLSANTGLYSVNVSSNDMILLNMAANNMLIELDCADNELIDISLPESLRILNCSNNSLSSLNVSALTVLKSLNASGNGIYSIDISTCTELESLDLSNNKLALIDVSPNTKLIPELVNMSGNVRELYINEENVAQITDAGIDIARLSKPAGAAIVADKGLVVDAGDKLPEKVSYTYDIGNEMSAEFVFVPVKVKKLVPSVKVLNLYLADGSVQPSYPVNVSAVGGAPEITWSSSNSAVATAAAEGKITPVTVGSTIITAAANGYDSAVIEVNVYYRTADVSIADIVVQFHTGSELKPEPVVKSSDKTLVKDKDYTLSYSNNKDIGEGVVIVKGIGTYRFTAEKSFRICYNIASLTAETVPDQTYTGNAITPDIVLYNGEYKLVKDTDYTLTYSNNTAIGTGIINVTGKGKYAGTRIQSFNITVPQVLNLVKSGNYKTKLILTWDVVPGADGYRIYKYNESTKKYAYLKQLNGSTANTYTDTNLTAATQYRYRVRAFVTVNNVKTYGKYSAKYITCTKPAAVTLTVKAGSKRAILSWKKITGATGYRIYMSTDGSKYTKIKTITKNTIVSFTKTGLTKGKKYYFKVRAYKTTNSVKVFGKYSSVKSVTSK